MPTQSVEGRIDLPAQSQSFLQSAKAFIREVLQALHAVRGEAVLRHECLTSFRQHLLATLPAAIPGRISNDDCSPGAETSNSLAESQLVIFRVMQRSVENGQIKLAVGKRQTIHLCLKSRKELRQPPTEMVRGGQAVLIVRQEIDCHRLMSSQRQTIAQPAVSRPQVQNRQSQWTASLHCRQKPVFNVLEGA